MGSWNLGYPYPNDQVLKAPLQFHKACFETLEGGGRVVGGFDVRRNNEVLSELEIEGAAMAV